MKGLRSRLSGSALTVGVVALMAAGGGYALAAGSSNVINACANKASGALRVAAHCTSKETALSWNRVGPRGPAGPGAKLLVYNAVPAGPTEVPTKVGTVGPWTIYGQCVVDNAGLVQAYLYSRGPAFTQDVWGVDDDNQIVPATQTVPATVGNKQQIQLGEAYSGPNGTGSSGYSRTLISKSGRYFENIVVIADAVNGGTRNSCHASDAVTPLG